MKFTSENGILTVYLEGDIDATNAGAVQAEIESAHAAHPSDEILFDAKNLVYISSAGLRVLIKFLKASGKKLTIRNVSNDVYEIFEITGIIALMNVQTA